MLVAKVLTELGYAAIEAADGAGAQPILRSNKRVDLLVTDVGLPGGINGRQRADFGRTARPGLKILFITGYAESTAIKTDLEGGMAILTKPFTIDSIVARVKELLFRRCVDPKRKRPVMAGMEVKMTDETRARAAERGAEGRKVLVVEDEVIIAMVIEDTLLELGVEIVGPVESLDAALRLAREASIDAAVLDVNIRGGNSYPVADVLDERGIPFVLCSGHGDLALGERHRHRPRLTKPYSMRALGDQVLELLKTPRA